MSDIIKYKEGGKKKKIRKEEVYLVFEPQLQRRSKRFQKLCSWKWLSSGQSCDRSNPLMIDRVKKTAWFWSKKSFFENTTTFWIVEGRNKLRPLMTVDRQKDAYKSCA